MKITKTLLLTSLLAIGKVGLADELGASAPYITAQRECLTDGMINPYGKEFRYLYSKDCRVVYVLPPAVMPQNIKGYGENLEGCSALNSARATISQQMTLVDNMTATLLQLEEKLAKDGDNPALEARIQRLMGRKRLYEQNEREAQQNLDDTYGKTPGAEFSILMNDNVSQTDLNAIRALNTASLERQIIKEIHEIPTDGKDRLVRTEQLTLHSALRAAPIGLSLYSFHYELPSEVGKNGGIIASDIPGLEYLTQQGSHSGAISVKGSGALAGKVVMSLPFACSNSVMNAEGRLQLKDQSVDPMFIVNRTFTMQEMFGQGYTARLNVNKVASEIVDRIDMDTQHGFRKSVTFNSDIVAHASELIDFNWTTEYAQSGNVTTAETLALEKAVVTKLIDDYIQKLVEQKILSPQEDPAVAPARGGTTAETGVANRCWTERNGGLSGMFGSRHSVCADYTYTYQVWHDGITKEEIKKTLKLEGETAETMLINQTAPFDFTTAFANSKAEDKKGVN